MNTNRSVAVKKAEVVDNAVPPEQSIGYQVRRLNQTLSLMMDGFTQTRNLSSAQWGYLRHLYFEDGLSQRELSDRIGRQGATTVSALKRLEAAGYVTSKRNQTDQRKNKVYLTKAGREIVADLMPAVRKVEEAAFRGFSDKEIDQFWKMVSRMRINVEGTMTRNWPIGEV